MTTSLVPALNATTRTRQRHLAGTTSPSRMAYLSVGSWIGFFSSPGQRQYMPWAGWIET
jgi:hypothetical protein